MIGSGDGVDEWRSEWGRGGGRGRRRGWRCEGGSHEMVHGGEVRLSWGGHVQRQGCSASAW